MTIPNAPGGAPVWGGVTEKSPEQLSHELIARIDERKLGLAKLEEWRETIALPHNQFTNIAVKNPFGGASFEYAPSGHRPEAIAYQLISEATLPLQAVIVEMAIQRAKADIAEATAKLKELVAGL